MDSIPTAVKVAALTLGASYFVAKELDERTAIFSDIHLAKTLGSYKKNVQTAFATKKTTTDFWYETLSRVPGDKRAIIFCEENGAADRVWTFAELEAYSNQMANFYIANGVQEGDTIALFMENRPEFIGTWLGATKAGIKVAMINTSIVKKGLAHCISVSGAKGLVYGNELEQALLEAELPSTSQLWSSEFLARELGKYSKDIGPNKLKERRSKQDFSSHWGYIYTSGTTGLPKAANIMHAKMYAFGGGVTMAFGVKPSDIVYTCLPLFHSAGGGLGAGMMLMNGTTMVLRKKFSAKAFFPDCIKYDVTVVQYIGELCRYLLASPVNKELERKHKIRVAIGNGLRPEIWQEFKTRFNIPEVGEFYGSTEGNGALFNHNLLNDKAGIGAVGRLGFLLKRLTGNILAKYDVERDELVRDKVTGFCVEAEPGQPGELLMPIKAGDPSTTFAGYSDAKATEKKIVRNAFAQGDSYFSTGDLLARDAQGYYRFVDRIGDTFRWKGENCSTTEVTEVVSIFPGVEEANVYGVQVPNNQDGRAPCAALTLAAAVEKTFDFNALLEHCKKNLPSYAVPLFIRVTPAIAVTATLKHQKGELRNEGIDISKVKDALYYWNGAEGYVRLTPQVYAKITTPGARL